MALQNLCDRCGNTEVDTVANRNLPNGWEKVLGVDLCPKCAKGIHEYLRPVPQVAEITELSGWRVDYHTRSFVKGHGVREIRVPLEKLEDMV